MRETKELRDVLNFDKKFKGLQQRAIDKVLSFSHVSAEAMKEMKIEGGDVRLLSVGQFEGFTTKDIASDNLCYGEVITIPTGGAANFKYHNGYFVDSGNILCSPKNVSINGKYVYYFLCKNVDLVDSMFQGASIRHPKMSEICKIRIPICSYEEQCRIVAELELLTEIINKQKQQLKELDTLARSIFYDMFGNPADNEREWKTLHIEDIVSKQKNSIKRGPFGGALKKEIFVSDGFLVYEQYHALNRDFLFERYYITEDKFKELSDFSVSPNDIIISCSGVNLGRLAIIPNKAKKGVINQALLKVTLDNKVMTNTMFDFIFTDARFKEKYFGDFRGCAIPNFPPMSEFKKFDFIVPPIEFQELFSKKIQSIESQKESINRSIAESQKLFDYTMDKYFG